MSTPTKPDIATNPAAIAREPRPVAVFDPYEFHRLRYLSESVSIADRNESGQWLVDAGFIGIGGKMILTNRRVK